MRLHMKFQWVILVFWEKAATGETKSAGETKSDITSTVQWRGFWQSIMRHNYKPLGSQESQKYIESALYFNPKTSEGYIDG